MSKGDEGSTVRSQAASVRDIIIAWGPRRVGRRQLSHLRDPIGQAQFSSDQR